MKKVLIIAYYWPPTGGAGVQRWLKFVKYLPEFGWEPIVYTPSNPESPAIDEGLLKDIREGTRVIRRPIWEPYQLYRIFTRKGEDEKVSSGFASEVESNKTREYIANFIRSNFFIPDARRFWIRPSIRHLSKYLKENPVDAIVSTGPPHSMHLIALGLKKRLGVKWVADFRDPWTNIDYIDELKLTGIARRKHQRLEKKVLQNADQRIIVGKVWGKELEALGDREVNVITNGYDSDDLEGQEVPLDKHFSIAHIGILNKHRNPLALWKALEELCEESEEFREDLRIVLIGKADLEVTKAIEKHGLEKQLEKPGYLAHEEAIRYQQKSQVLLLAINNSPNAKGILTGKVFEYMASRRPMIVIGPTDGEIARVMSETGAGLVSDFDDSVLLKEHVRSYYKEYKNDRLEANSQDVEKYSRRELTRSLSKVLNRTQ